MSGDRQARIKELFLASCNLPANARPIFLEENCGGDAELRHEIESLLSYHDGAPDSPEELVSPRINFEPLLELPAAPSGGSSETVSERVRDYRIVQKLGEGGMGEVYEAEQERPVRRRVALKLIKWGMATKQVVARFESERQALALMSHPNIARVFGAGSTEMGRPYFAMEYVPGVSITEYCDTERLATRQRLQLFVQVCQGVQHAHQKGIIHRDLKPSNVLVTIEDGEPLPKIIDFGVAKAIEQRLTEKTLFTELGQWIGTPEYMSPEQAEMTGVDIDTRSDVYSLGVLLYELLVGAQPFDSRQLREAGFDEMRRRIREEEPTRPSTKISTMGDDSQAAARNRRTNVPSLTRELRGDLDWITLKALEKDRSRRYGSCIELASDVERYLRNDPVLATPPGTLYRAGKFIRRHRLGVAASAVVLAAIFIGIAFAGIGLVQSRRAERAASEDARAARQASDFLVGMFAELDPWRLAAPATSVPEILDRGAGRIETELAGQPLVQARLMDTIGQAYLNLGHYREARPLLEKALAIRRELLGEEHLDVARSHRSLGWLFFWTLERGAARSHYERALEIREKILGPEHDVVASSLNDLADVLVETGNHEQAEPLLDRALAIVEKTHGPEHVRVSDVLYIRARMSHEAGRWEEAQSLYERALAIREKGVGREHGGVGWIVFDLGRLHYDRGRVEEARRHFERALEIQERALGAEHPAVASALEKIGFLEYRSSNHGRARELYERSLAICRNAFGAGHPRLALPLYNLACLAALEGDRDRALDLLRQSLESDFSSPILLDDPDLNTLHGDPEYEAIVEEVKRRNLPGAP
jgi:non-specific serine/threonine protein kinase/serine/threonine-protein kinase